MLLRTVRIVGAESTAEGPVDVLLRGGGSPRSRRASKLRMPRSSLSMAGS
ncbi:hypothetical protein [Homoserinibacter gongjuensis]|nr:hypothetical protein [Homoserinibacter gongjuensis]